MNNKTKMIAMVVLGVITVVTLFAMTVPRDRSLTDLQKTGVIRIGYAVEAPFLFLSQGGEVTGAEAEVAKVIVGRLGIRHIEWQLYEFGELIPALEAKRIDAIVAGMFITPQRATRVSFSEPTFHVQQGLLVAAGNPRQLHSYAQAASLPGVKIAVISGAVEESILKQLGLPDTQIIQVPDALTGQVAVETGLADGLALSALTICWMASQEQLGRTEMAQPFEQSDLVHNQYSGYGAVVFRQGDDQLRTAWNAALKTFIGSSQHLKLIAEFGFTSNELPGTVTTQEVISQP